MNLNISGSILVKFMSPKQLKLKSDENTSPRDWIVNLDLGMIKFHSNVQFHAKSG